MTDPRTLLRSQGLAFTAREGWGARHPYHKRPTVSLPTRCLFLHVAVIADPDDLVGTEREKMRVLERIGVERFSSGISYNWAVFDTGRAYEGQPLDRKGAHTVNDKGVTGFPKNLNFFGYAVVLPQMGTDEVTDEQVDAVARFGAACRRAKLTVANEFLPHQMFANKACPGAPALKRLPEINKLMAHYVRVGLNPATLTTKSEDLPVDQKTFDALLLNAITKNPQIKAELQVAPWRQLVGRTGKSAHDTLFGEMKGLLVDAADDDEQDETPEPTP
jgi:hypothetical protein